MVSIRDRGQTVAARGWGERTGSWGFVGTDLQGGNRDPFWSRMLGMVAFHAAEPGAENG